MKLTIVFCFRSSVRPPPTSTENTKKNSTPSSTEDTKTDDYSKTASVVAAKKLNAEETKRIESDKRMGLSETSSDKK